MSKDPKSLTRPKVRFSKITEYEQVMNNEKNTVISETAGKTNGPKIRSIVILDKPIKLIKQHKSNVTEDTSTGQNNYTENTKEIPVTITKSANRTEQTTLTDVCHIENTKELVESNSTQYHRSISPNNIEIVVPPLQLPNEENDEICDKLLLRSTAKTKNVQSNGKNVKGNKGKENKGTVVNVTSKSTNTIKKKFPEPTCLKFKSQQKPEVQIIDKTIKPLVTRHTSNRKIVNAKDKISNVMPCHKYKILDKKKVSSINKTVIRDIVGGKVNAEIKTGTLRKKIETAKDMMSTSKVVKKCDYLDERLAKPKYNSIVCSMNKLEELRREKIITDVENLPPAYKNLIYVKVSNALDFPLDEAIYKNLVDLSIDEKQLPIRITRSKDPEPTQKDIVPALSAFFAPGELDDYCTSISPKPCVTENIDNWNAFKISDKILEWKHSMDNIQ